MSDLQKEREAHYYEVKRHEIKEKAQKLQDFIRHKFNLTLDRDDLEFYMEHFFGYEGQLVNQEIDKVKSYDEIVQHLSDAIFVNTERSIICVKKFLEAVGASINLVEIRPGQPMIKMEATLGQDYLLNVRCFVTWNNSRIVPEFIIDYRLTNNRLWDDGAIASSTTAKINVDDLKKDFETLFRKHKAVLSEPFIKGYRSS